MTPSIESSGTKRKATSIPHFTKRRKGHGTSKSVWNSTDDWDQLIADSQLSTSSISVRRPRPRGLQTLVRCATEAAARGFKRLWEEPGGSSAMGGVSGEVWREMWDWVPDHLKVGVRDAVFRDWGGYLTSDMLSSVFAIPPTLYWPGALLPAVGGAALLKPFWPKELSGYTTLILTNCNTASDTAIAGMIYHMPKLEVINLKGCILAGEKTIATIIKRCPGLKRLNLKGTAVSGEGAKKVLAAFGSTLTAFKIDDTLIENVNDTFETTQYSAITHLCLPGDMLNVSLKDQQHMRRTGPAQAHPVAKPTPGDSNIDWATFSSTFPSLTHLYLPRLFLPDTIFGIRENTLVKLSLGADPPIPIRPLTGLIESQKRSLKSLQLGYIGLSPRLTRTDEEKEFYVLGVETLAECRLETFKLRCGETRDTRAISAMKIYSPYLLEGLRGTWRRTLKYLTVDVPGTIPTSLFLPDQPDTACPTLEVLELPGAAWAGPDTFVEVISKFRLLRSLDLSKTVITDDQIFELLDSCSLISRIDLTSCRGVKVQYRRNIFKARRDQRAERQDAGTSRGRP